MDDQQPSPKPEPDQLVDPFVPEVVRVMTDQGVGINVVETVKNYAEAQLPAISSSQLQMGDRLTVEFDNEAVRHLKVISVSPESQAFGSDDIRSPQLLVQDDQVEHEDEPAQPFFIAGSAISPRGTMMTPGVVKVGYFLVSSSDEHISSGEVKSFLLERPDENGDLQEVHLNQNQETTPSPSFTDVKQVFVDIEEALNTTGFKFEQRGADDFFADYHKADEEKLVFASRQGFGCAVIPQDEVYVYSAAHGALFGMRHLPTKGMMQIVAMQATPEQFAQATFGQADWRGGLGVSSPTLHRLSKHSPSVTYTWLNSGQESPNVTVVVSEEYIGEAMADGVSANHCYADVNIDLSDSEPQVSVSRIPYWVDDTDGYREKLAQASSFTRSEDMVQGRIGNISLEIPSSPMAYANYMKQEIHALTAE